MNIKSSKELVEEANQQIKTLSPEEVKSLEKKGEVTLIDVRHWELKEGTLETQFTYPRNA